MHSCYKDSDANTLIEQESRHDQRHSLTQAVEALHTPQQIYMPGVFHLLDDIDPNSVTNAPECTKLWLPSSLPAASRDGWCLFDLPLIEFWLRYAQAIDSLNEIRRLHCLYRGLVLQKKKHLPPSQKMMTQSHGVFKGLNAWISRVAAFYCDVCCCVLLGCWGKCLGNDNTDPSRSSGFPNPSYHLLSSLKRYIFIYPSICLRGL